MFLKDHEECVTVSVDSLRNLSMIVLQTHGLDVQEARMVTDEIMDAELRGRTTHGTIRLLRILDEINQRRGEIHIVHENSYTALVEGGDNLGSVVSHFCVHLAIEKASASGIAVIGCRNKFTFITPGYYARMIAKKDLVAILVSSSGEHVAPWGGIDPILGTNPLAFAFSSETEPIVGDLATAVLPSLDIREAEKQKKPIPLNTAFDRLGNLTTNPNEALEGAQLVFGGYKGYCVNLLIELLSSSLIGIDKSANQKCGMLFIVINPNSFGTIEAFKHNVSRLTERIKSSRKAGGVEEIWVPGDRSKIRLDKTIKMGVQVPKTLLSNLRTLAQKNSVYKKDEQHSS